MGKVCREVGCLCLAMPSQGQCEDTTDFVASLNCLTHLRCLIIFGNDLLLGGLASPLSTGAICSDVQQGLGTPEYFFITGGQCGLSVQGGGLSVSGDAFIGPGANVKILPTSLPVSIVSPTFDV